MLDYNCSPQFGIEQEHFIFHNGLPPSLSRVQDFFESLIKVGYSAVKHCKKRRPLVLCKESKWGAVVVKNDYCTHILEIVFPPMRSFAGFKKLYQATVDEIIRSLAVHELELRYGAILHECPEKVVTAIFEEGVKERYKRYARREIEAKAFTIYDFSAVVAATQIHLEVPEELLYSSLPPLYSLEYLFPLLFSNSKTYERISAHCLRPLIYQDSFSSQYIFNGFPDRVPGTREEYQDLIGQSVGFFRDYSFLAPSRYGTIEFRTCDSQDTVDDILQVLALRYATFFACRNVDFCEGKSRDIFLEVCRNGSVPQPILKRDTRLLELAAFNMNAELQSYLSSSLERLNFLISE